MFSQINLKKTNKKTNKQTHRAPGTYTVNHTCVIKFIKMTLNSKHSADRKHRKHRKTKQSRFPKEQI